MKVSARTIARHLPRRRRSSARRASWRTSMRTGRTSSASNGECRDQQRDHGGDEQTHAHEDADGPIRSRADDPEQCAAAATAITRPQEGARGFRDVVSVRTTHVEAAAAGATSLHGFPSKRIWTARKQVSCAYGFAAMLRIRRPSKRVLGGHARSLRAVVGTAFDRRNRGGRTRIAAERSAAAMTAATGTAATSDGQVPAARVSTGLVALVSADAAVDGGNERCRYYVNAGATSTRSPAKFTRCRTGLWSRPSRDRGVSARGARPDPGRRTSCPAQARTSSRAPSQATPGRSSQVPYATPIRERCAVILAPASAFRESARLCQIKDVRYTSFDLCLADDVRGPIGRIPFTTRNVPRHRRDRRGALSTQLRRGKPRCVPQRDGRRRCCPSRHVPYIVSIWFRLGYPARATCSATKDSRVLETFSGSA